MKESKQEIELEYNANDIFNIVLDIKKYPIYIPWCTDIEILKINKNKIKANMTVNYKLFPSQIFMSDVSFDKKKLFIKTDYVKGPLKDLKTEWKFIKINETNCKVIFSVKFEFKNFFYQKLAELFFPLIEKQMIESFIKRAKEILN